MKRLILALALLLPAIAWAANTATFSWGAVTQNTDGTTITGPVTYNIYQTACGSTSGGSQVASGITGLAYVISTGLADGTTYCWNLTAVAGGVESAYSNQATKTFLPGTPAASSTFTVK